ncbi:MAG TPA: hypothetical protein PLN52_26105, partial [Opitutaceae bacterium]|nr:hypothetical protein [Opitutaceae bacterium]
LVWKEKKVSFGGVAKLDLAREICNGVFTIPDLATPPVYSDGYNDGNEDEDNDRGDWWKGGSK